jgi:dolichol-phosphate mannosyltransferase
MDSPGTRSEALIKGVEKLQDKFISEIGYQTEQPARRPPSLKQPAISVIVPTYKEAENLPILLDRLSDLRRDKCMDLELLIMDDNSSDGTEELIAARNEAWVRLVTRTTDRGLSNAVCDGLKLAQGDVIVVMDADLSHPPESIPALVKALMDGYDFALGSRYVKGGSTSDDWGLFRWLNSRVATLLALPFTNVRDPMSGFFAIRRLTYEGGANKLNPIGYKIGLELIVKCGCEMVKEIPIHFADRKFGESKLTFAEQARYIKHIRRLFIYKYGTWSHLAQFLVVGGLGTGVNLAALTLLIALGFGVNVSIGAAIAISMVFNFLLNRRFTFAYARDGSIVRQFFGFIAACSLGALLNYFIASALVAQFPVLYPQVAAVIGIIAGTGVNFLFNRFAVFKTTHYRPD